MQPEYFVNIKSGSTVQGSGPITSISDWTVTRRMDAAGSWSFRMSAADAQAGQVVLKRSVEIYAFVGTAYAIVGTGIIDNIERQIDAAGLESLIVSGDDDLRELTYRTVGNLETTATTSAIVWSQAGSLGSSSGISSVIYAAGRLIAGTSDGHIFTSDDSGATWTDRGQIASETDIPIVFDSQYSGQLLAIGASGNTYRSTTNGTSWNSGIVYMAWAADAPFLRGGTDYGGSDPYYYIMAIGANVYRYAGFLPPTSLGSWTNIGALGAETSAPSTLKVTTSILLMGTAPNGKIFRSTNNGVTWSDLGQLGAETKVACMAVNGATVVAGTSPNGKIYRSTDSGATWGLAASLASASIVSCLLYTGGSTYVAGTGANGKIYRSTDDGVNWSEIGDLTENQITALINIGNGLAFTDGSQYAYGNAVVYTEANATHAEAVDQLELVAPAGWTFNADASPTNDDIYIQFAGETLLQAVLRLAEITQTHCYLSAPRTLTFGDSWSSSGVHAVQPNGGSLDAAVVAIINLSKREDAYDLITRIYPWGRDVDNDVAGIAATTLTASAFSGFTIYPTNNYIVWDAGETAYGRIERWVNYDDIRAATASNSFMADSVIRAAIAEMNRSVAPVINYELLLGGCAQLLEPMETIRVTWTGDVKIDADLYIIESTWRGDQSGIVTTNLVVGTSAVRLESDYEVTAKAISRVAQVAAR